MSVWRAGACMAVVALTAACTTGSSIPEALITTESAPAAPYQGPLQVAVPERDQEDPIKGAVAAVGALECQGKPYHGGIGAEWGVEAGGDSPADALHLFMEDGGAEVPKTGYRVEREEAQRVLYSFDAGGRTKVAVIVAKDSGPDRPGWGMETYAQCDPAEFPASTDDGMRISVWSDKDGQRVPVTKVMSANGPEHCDWQNTVFLHLGKEQYFRDPEDKLPHSMLNSAYAEDVRLPADATDTGYRLDDRQLWLAADGSDAYVKTPGGVERWPGAVEQIACA